MDEQSVHMESINPLAIRDGLKFYNANEAPFKLYGVFYDGERFRRMPSEVDRAVKEESGGIAISSKDTAGGRIRFATNSPYITIKCRWSLLGAMSHMALTGSSGFDLYIYENGKEEYNGTFRPELANAQSGYSSTKDLGETKKDRIININFPLYNELEELYIGIKEGSTLSEAPDYKYEKPIVYYGSSITQGGCASRPGMSYQAIITRKYDINHINLGFSGRARGERAMAEYIAGLNMSAFVLDYDYNAPTAEHLKATHERFYKIIREKNPTLPIIIMSAPTKKKGGEWWKNREAIIEQTYENALISGDRNVYFISGCELMPDNDGTVDTCHPNDYGFACMASRLSKVIETILK